MFYIMHLLKVLIQYEVFNKDVVQYCPWEANSQLWRNKVSSWVTDIMSEAVSKVCLDFPEAETSVADTLSGSLGREGGLDRFQESLGKKTDVIYISYNIHL